MTIIKYKVIYIIMDASIITRTVCSFIIKVNIRKLICIIKVNMNNTFTRDGW